MSARPSPLSAPSRRLLCALLLAAPALAGETTRASVDSAGAEANDQSFDASVSGSGRLVAFTSRATNLVASDTNSHDDIFVHDRKTGTTTRISVASDGQQATGHSSRPAISKNGRFVAFESLAENLAPGSNNSLDIFRHELKTGATTLVSVDANGGPTNDDSSAAAISANGQFVAFESLATDLVVGDTNGQYDVFVRDMQAGVTTRVSVSSAGEQATGGASRQPAISANGRFVAFESEAVDLVTGDSNGLQDIFVHDLKTGTTVRVTLDSAGVQVSDFEAGRPSLSANGRYVAFASMSAELVAGDLNGLRDVFVRDVKKGLTTRESLGPGGVEAVDDGSNTPELSASGRLVAFESGASNLVAGDTNGNFDVFLHDRKSGKTTRLSTDSAGLAVGGGEDPSISSSGKFVAFESLAVDLVDGDTNATNDVFLHRKN